MQSRILVSVILLYLRQDTMLECQPPHPTGDASERDYRPDTPEQKEPRHDLSREVGALACGDACPYRGELDSQETDRSPTQAKGREHMASSIAELQPTAGIRSILVAMRQAISVHARKHSLRHTHTQTGHLRRDTNGKEPDTDTEPVDDEQYVFLTSHPDISRSPIKVKIPRKLYEGLYERGSFFSKEIEVLQRRIDHYEDLYKRLVKWEQNGFADTEEKMLALVNLQLQVIGSIDRLRDRIGEIECGPYRYEVVSSVAG